MRLHAANTACRWSEGGLCTTIAATGRNQTVNPGQ